MDGQYDLSSLPSNYDFEIPKTISSLHASSVQHVALQLPEGLLQYALALTDILQRYVPGLEVLIMGDVTYGACCVDDFTAKEAGCEMIVHYAHSCLVPVDVTSIKILYVFVNISIDIQHFMDTIRLNFSQTKKLVFVSTVQFIATLQNAKRSLVPEYDILVPQARPLSPGEILGCTSPKVPDYDALVYLGDGRFHLESMMIQNPHLEAFRYDPYAKKFTQEYYEHDEMHAARTQAIEQASTAKNFGLILGTLGRQGSTKVMDNLIAQLKRRQLRYTIMLIPEIFPEALAAYTEVDAWIQVACPRLSIDWGYAFTKPLLSPYEASVVFEAIPYQTVYPMDYYSKNSLGPWTPKYEDPTSIKQRPSRLRKHLPSS